jgi:uncharacterized membrane protein YkvA (DUF1232 family)
MLGRFRFFKRLFLELPQQLRLAYCLIRDPRVPATTKAAFGGGIVLSLLPQVGIPKRIPFLGEIDTLAIALLATKLFIQSCPDDVVIDVEQQIIEQRSVFDDDVRRGEGIALSLFGRFRGEPVHDIFGTAARDAASTHSAEYTE